MITDPEQGTSRPLQAEDVKRLAEMIKDIRFAMLTTQALDGTLRSRPMATQQVEFDGDLWFFAAKSSDKVAEIKASPAVNVSLADPDDQRYVSVTGSASLVEDRAKAAELWSPAYKTWFPNGLDDPELILLKVDVSGAEYWDAPSSKMVRMAGFAKAIVTGQRYEGGENREIDFRR